jgi:ribosomal protein L32
MAHPKRKISKTRRRDKKNTLQSYCSTIATITVKHIYTTELIMKENVLQRQVVIDKSVAVA